MFGMLQKVTATQLGMNPVLTVTANLLGGSMGKLISPQSIAIACAATGLIGKDGLMPHNPQQRRLIAFPPWISVKNCPSGLIARKGSFPHWPRSAQCS
ncbi:L-lactate permease-like protein [Desulfitobacterium hafniense DCB-2]|uniref:L-lactate permease n=3 Tax=Desulfitobacterium hafniense TaxID=49338 RepID=Q24XB3_DESHY|nr:L-lactate permease-like protein [Desulfitobacterium hafniense DCB-2]EHL07264.1 hypothetical protein HMPREF0322_02023 [Desulfitobacterium hafniense DP7]BAE83329.1 hypothetical protein DSY1540 [Desulfitobacterium hafniense Y51]